MANPKKFFILKEFLTVVLISMLGCVGIVFTVLYIETFTSGFFADYSKVSIAVSVGLISILTILSITFFKRSNKLIFKLSLITILIISFVMLLLFCLKKSGVFERVKSVDEFRDYIAKFGNMAVLVFILIQLLQVVILPIPAFITVGAGVLLFGPFKGALYSCVGIISGSIIAYFIGRIFGVKTVKWLVGESNLDKGLKTIKGKDKLILTFMFLFPFFPDDLLCFVAGITTISPKFFVVMIIITRIISVFASSYSINNSIIPYNTWWGILLWILFFLLTIILSILIYKKGDLIEKRIFNKSKKY